MSLAVDQLSEEQREIVELVRQFTDEQIIPVASEYERTDTFPDEIVEGLRELGIFGFTVPEEYGGLGLDLTTYALAVSELSRGWMSISGIINTHFIVVNMLMRDGTDEQKQRFLPRMATGEIRGAFSMTEPECGSDVQAIRSSRGARRRRLHRQRPEDVGHKRPALRRRRPAGEDRHRDHARPQGNELPAGGEDPGAARRAV